MAGAYGGRADLSVTGSAPTPDTAPAPAPAAPRPGSAAPSDEPARVVDPAPAAPGRWERMVPAVRERLPMWLRLRCGLEPRTLAALTVVLVAAAVFAAVHFWSVRPQTVRAPDPVNERAHAPAPDPMTDPVHTPEPSPGPPATPGPDGRIVVDVSGKVRRPGIYPLPSGARVADALRAAGGVRPGVDITGLNRARVLLDGEQVVVGAPPGALASGATGGAGTGSPGGPAAGPVSLNSATVEQLDTLPGVGPVLAQHILDYRTQHGGFRSVDELREVNGIGDRRFADLQPLVRP